MRIFYIIVLTGVFTFCFSQGFRSRIYLPGSVNHRTQAIFPVSGNKYIGTGFSLENINGKQVNRLTILGLDSMGKLEWVKKYGDTSFLYFTNSFISRTIMLHKDHLYYAGCARDTSNKQVGVFVKIDLQGDTVWQRIYRDPDPQEDVIPQMVAPGVDSGFLITGFFQHWGQNTSRCMLIKTDAYGNELWRKKIDKLPPNTQDGKSIVQDSATKKIVITGYMYGPSSLVYDNLLILDSLGNKLHHGGYFEGLATGLVQSRNKQILVAGYKIITDQNGSYEEATLTNVDINKPIPAKWKKIWSSQDYNSNANNVIKETSGGSFMLAQSRERKHDNQLLAFIRVDTSGDCYWEKSYDYDLDAGLLDFSPTADGGWVGAFAVIFNKPANPFFFVKYDSTGCDTTLAYCALVSALEENEVVAPGVFPIPCNDVLYIKNTTGHLWGELFDGTGRLCREFQLAGGDETTTISTAGLSSGVYLLRLVAGDNVLSKKVLVQH